MEKLQSPTEVEHFIYLRLASIWRRGMEDDDLGTALVAGDHLVEHSAVDVATNTLALYGGEIKTALTHLLLIHDYVSNRSPRSSSPIYHQVAQLYEAAIFRILINDL